MLDARCSQREYHVASIKESASPPENEDYETFFKATYFKI